MPKETFFNLKKEKRDKVTQGLLEEFTYHNFDDASLSAAVKKIGIAKGSIYQYFEDKKDVFFYLIEHCGEIKKQFLKDINRNDYEDFWAYFRAVYDYGYDMLEHYPMESAFLHLLIDNMNSPSLEGIFPMMKKQAVDQMIVWVQPEVEQGHFRNDLSIRELSFYLYTVSSSIIDYLKEFQELDIKEKAKHKEQVYGKKGKAKFMAAVDANITFLKKAMNA